MRERNTFAFIALFSMSCVLLAATTHPLQDRGGDDEAQQQESEKSDEKEKTEELTLEKLFPEKSFFGPSARGASFSRDGRYAAYLYRPYKERRHGNDIWLLDTETGEVERLTSVVVMAEFQEETRTVRKDREEKAKKAGIGKKKDDDTETEETEEEQEDEAETPPAGDDPVTGRWEGKLKGGEDLGFPPDGLNFTLTLQLHEGNVVTGTMNAAGQSVNLSGGTFDPRTGELKAHLVDEESGEGASMSLTISDAGISGAVSIDALGVTFELEGTRVSTEIDDEGGGEGEGGGTAPPQDAQKQQDQDEQSDVKQDDGEEDEEIILGNWVSDKDADDERAPRYDGIRDFIWSPTASEMIFDSQGDLYRFDIESREITRLTRTEEREGGVEYLPDGTGYTYSASGGLRCVRFGSHLHEQLDPDLPGDESMWAYELSPDGKRMAFVTRKTNGRPSTQTVNIMTFRSRFSQVRTVSRQVSDDDRTSTEFALYLYDFGDMWTENGNLNKVFTHTSTGPRDVFQRPNWSPDSSKVAWAVYAQNTGLLGIYQAGFEEKTDEEEPGDEADASAEEGSDNGGDDDQNGDNQNGENENGADDEAADDDDADAAAEPEYEITDARMVYRFYHHGGPTSPDMTQPYFLSDSRRLAFVSEISGFRHVHVLDPIYESLEQVTRGRYEVYPFDMSKDHKYLFATATREHPTREDLYRIDLESGEMTRLSQVDGVYSSFDGGVSHDGTRALAMHETFGDLQELEYIDLNNGEEKQRELTDSHPQEAWEITKPAPEFFTYANRHGHEIHGTMFKPDDFAPGDKRPLLIYVYGGPLGTRKQVVDGSYSSASYFFGYYMAKKHGYVTVTIDPRGVSGFGAVFEKANYEQVGKPQVEDLVDGVKFLVENHGVDPKRVGMHGWSFGGFQTQMCLYTEPDVFQVGIAGAGPTEWENYNQWYTTGTIFNTTATGKAELKEYSLLPLAKNLKGKLLLIHGMEDSNVLYQDTVNLYRELLKAGKETNVELFLDPTGGHGLGGDVKTLNRYRKYEDFLLRYLGNGAPAQPATTTKDEQEE